MLTAECLRSCAGVRAFQTSDYKLKSRIFLKCFSNLLSFFSTTMLVNEYLLMSDVWKALTPAHDPKLSSFKKCFQAVCTWSFRYEGFT